MSHRLEGSRRGQAHGRRVSVAALEMLEDRRLFASMLVGLSGNQGSDTHEDETLFEINLLKPGKGGSVQGFEDAPGDPVAVLTPGARVGFTNGNGSLEVAVPQTPAPFWGIRSPNVIDLLRAGAHTLTYDITMNAVDLNGGSFGPAGSGDDSFNGFAQSNELALNIGGEWFQQTAANAATDDTGRNGQWNGVDGTHHMTWDLTKFTTSLNGVSMATVLADPTVTNGQIWFVTQGADSNGNQGPMRFYFDYIRLTAPSGTTDIGDFEPTPTTKIVSLPFLADSQTIGYNPDNGLIYRTGGSETWSNNPTSAGFRDNQAMHTVDPNAPHALNWIFNANPEQYGGPAPRPTWVLPTTRRTDDQITDEYRVRGPNEYHGLRGLAWSDEENLFYGTDEHGLFKLTPAGESTFVGQPPGEEGFKGITFFTMGGERVLLVSEKEGPELWTVDPETGQYVGDPFVLSWPSGNTVDGVLALAENPDDPTMLLAVVKPEGGGSPFARELVRIDTVTGVVTSYGSLDLHIAAIAFVPVQGPQITDVYVRNAAWEGDDADAGNVTFKEYMQAQGLGHVEYGFKLPAVPTNADTVPWLGVNQVVVRYSAPVTGTGVPTPGSITLDGARSDYTVTTVTAIDDRTYVFTLDRALGNQPGGGSDGDRIRLRVGGAGPGGADFQQIINALQGDASRDALGRVNAADQGYVKSRLNRTTNAPTSGTQAAYTIFADVTGDGRVNAADQGAVKSRANDSLGGAIAVSEEFSSTRIADEVLA